ncbi:T9SS type A sorting domain-containing protein [Maribellus mangrovi]|uniref:T9SS type A sorting domain-containing protein n=1 Tax=Maribellus mangrovi TaxID=3133146 RepID=UPI0030EC4623
MKQVFILISVVFFALQVKAQYIYDEYDEVIPYTLTEKYKDIIEKNQIHSVLLPHYDNDSIYFKSNKVNSYDEVDSRYAQVVGFSIDTNIVFQDYASKVNIDEGTLWIMTLESSTAQYLGISIEQLDFPDEAYFTVYPGTIPGVIVEPEVAFKESMNDWAKGNCFETKVYDKKIVIEFFVPKEIRSKPNFILKKIDYGFKGLGRPGSKMNYEKIKKENSGGSSSILKSGGLTNTPALTCQQDVVCASVNGWSQEAKSVVNIKIPYTYNNNNYESQGTGFFINKAGNGYSDSDQPIIVTCGHLFAPEVTPGNHYDISGTHGKIQIYVDYENQSCNETKTRYGKNIVAGFSSANRLKLGSSYIVASNYNESQDYAILQPSKTVDKLKKYNIEYAGWTSNPDYLQEGYAAIGHPAGDVKKVNIENSRAWANADNFGLYFDVGVSEHGFSGSPIFNSSKKIVGWLCTGTGSCSTVGQTSSSNHTSCGRFDNLHFDIMTYVDPTGIGLAQNTNPQPPTPEELPSHCSNCVQDDDETGIHCGGSCYPCGMQDVLAIKNDLDLQGEKKSRYEIFAEPDPGSLLCLKSGNSSLEAGMNVYLNGGFEVQKGATFYAGIDAELMSEADRGCQPSCVNLANVFTPNGDGVNDYWVFSQTFVTSYDLLIWDRNNQIVYSESNQPVYENGVIFAWDGSGTSNGEVYYGTLTYTDCYGNTYSEPFFTHTYKSAEILSENSLIEENKQAKVIEVEMNEESGYIKAYPNPFNDKIHVEYTGNTFPLEYKIFDASGRLILKNSIDSNTEEINLGGYSPGNYIINAKAGVYNLSQKLIKK